MWSVVNIETHNVCNLGCKHCPYTSMTRPKQAMSVELFQKIVGDIVINRIGTANLNIYGEPLLDPLIFDRIRYCKERSLKVQFTSNGTLLNDDTIGRLIDSKIDLIYFSFDGSNKEEYENIRIGSDFSKTKESIENLLERKGKLPKVVIVSVLKSQNIWKDKADGFQTWPIDNRRILGLNSQVKTKRSFPCSRIFRELNILSNGKVALCCLDFDGRKIIGDLNISSISEVWNSMLFRTIQTIHLRGNRQLINICKDCMRPSIEKLSWRRALWNLL